MTKNKIIKTTILAGIFSTAFAENNNNPNTYRNFDWEDPTGILIGRIF